MRQGVSVAVTSQHPFYPWTVLFDPGTSLYHDLSANPFETEITRSVLVANWRAFVQFNDFDPLKKDGGHKLVAAALEKLHKAGDAAKTAQVRRRLQEKRTT